MVGTPWIHSNISCSTSVKLFIRSLFSSKRHVFHGQKTINENGSIRLGHKLKLVNDHIVLVHLHNMHAYNFDLYETCWKNHVRFNTIEFNSTNETCDSCVLFRDEQQTSCGFIRAILF